MLIVAIILYVLGYFHHLIDLIEPDGFPRYRVDKCILLAACLLWFISPFIYVIDKIRYND